MSSTAPQKEYISTTNHHGGTLHSSYYQLRRAHFGHPYTCTAPLPITTGALKIPIFGHPLFLTYLPTTKHHGGAPNTILWTPLILTYLPKHHRGATKTLFGHPSSTTNLHGRTLFGHPSSSTHFSTTNLHRHTLFGHPITYTQLWSLYCFPLFV